MLCSSAKKEHLLYPSLGSRPEYEAVLLVGGVATAVEPRIVCLHAGLIEHADRLWYGLRSLPPSAERSPPLKARRTPSCPALFSFTDSATRRCPRAARSQTCAPVCPRAPSGF